MKIEVIGDWLRISNCNLEKYIRISDISSVEVDSEMFTIRLHIKGCSSFQFLSFYEDKNNFQSSVQLILQAIGAFSI